MVKSRRASVETQPLGIGQPQPVTTAQINQYLAAVDAASDRVQTGVMATAWSGQPLEYAIVSHQGNMGKLAKLAANIRALRDPRALSDAAAADIIAKNPDIVWITGNVHGGEKSGADASLKVLYELASRVDCQVMNEVKNTITVIVPTQNPDGRDNNRRQNNYGLDMNRDWFARTQPETQGKIDLLRQFPPQVYVDAHERGGRDYFFPPNADPIHHEIADQPLAVRIASRIFSRFLFAWGIGASTSAASARMRSRSFATRSRLNATGCVLRGGGGAFRGPPRARWWAGDAA